MHSAEYILTLFLKLMCQIWKTIIKNFNVKKIMRKNHSTNQQRQLKTQRIKNELIKYQNQEVAKFDKKEPKEKDEASKNRSSSTLVSKKKQIDSLFKKQNKKTDHSMKKQPKKLKKDFKKESKTNLTSRPKSCDKKIAVQVKLIKKVIPKFAPDSNSLQAISQVRSPSVKDGHINYINIRQKMCNQTDEKVSHRKYYSSLSQQDNFLDKILKQNQQFIERIQMLEKQNIDIETRSKERQQSMLFQSNEQRKKMQRDIELLKDQLKFLSSENNHLQQAINTKDSDVNQMIQKEKMVEHQIEEQKKQGKYLLQINETNKQTEEKYRNQIVILQGKIDQAWNHKVRYEEKLKSCEEERKHIKQNAITTLGVLRQYKQNQ